MNKNLLQVIIIISLIIITNQSFSQQKIGLASPNRTTVHQMDDLIYDFSNLDSKIVTDIISQSNPSSFQCGTMEYLELQKKS